MMVKLHQVIKLSAINLKGLSSRLKTEVPFCIDTTVTYGSFIKENVFVYMKETSMSCNPVAGFRRYSMENSAPTSVLRNWSK